MLLFFGFFSHWNMREKEPKWADDADEDPSPDDDYFRVIIPPLRIKRLS